MADPVTDPSILEELNAPAAPAAPVTDPAILSELEAAPPLPSPEVRALREDRPVVEAQAQVDILRGIRGAKPAPPAPEQGSDAEQAAALLKYQAENDLGLSPEKSARVLRAAAATQHPVDYLLEHPEVVDQLEKDVPDFRPIAEQHPGLRDFLLANPAQFALVKNVSGALRGWDAALGRVTRATAAEVAARPDAPEWVKDFAKTNPDVVVERSGYVPPGPIDLILRSFRYDMPEMVHKGLAAASAARSEWSEEDLAAERIRRRMGFHGMGGPDAAFTTPPVSEGMEERIRDRQADEAWLRTVESYPEFFDPTGAVRRRLGVTSGLEKFHAGQVEAVERLKTEVSGIQDYGDFSRRLAGQLVYAPAKFTRVLAMNAAAAVAGGAVAGPEGAIGASFLYNLGELWPTAAYDLQQTAGPGGKKINPGKANELALVSSIFNSAVMTVPYSRVVKKFPGLAGLLESATVRTGERMLVQPEVKRVLWDAVREYGFDVAAGGAAMGVSAVATRLTSEVAQKDVDPTHEIDWGAAGKDGLEQGLAAIRDFAVISSFGAGRTLLRDGGRQRAVLKSEQDIKALVEKTAPLADIINAAPVEARRLFQAMIDGGGPNAGLTDKVYADLPGFQKYFQGQKMDPREVAAQLLGDNGAAYDKAVAEKADHLAIPTPDFATKLAAGALAKHGEGLLPDLTTSPGIDTPRRAAEQSKRRAKLIKQFKDLAPDKMDEDQRRVFSDYRQQAIDAGRHEDEASAAAALMSAGMKVMAKDAGRGETAWDLWQANPVNIHGPVTRESRARMHLEDALKDYDATPAGRAHAFLRGEVPEGVQELAGAHQARAVEAGKAEAPPALRNRLAAIQREIQAIEGESSGMREGAPALERPSPTRKVRVSLTPDPEGGTRLEVGRGDREVALPAWLKPEEFTGARQAWEWTWSAVKDGPAAPEAVQRAVHAFMARGLEGFPPNEFALKQGFALARLAAGKGGRKFKVVRERLADWAEKPEATRGPPPIPEQAWGALIDTARADTDLQGTSRGYYNKVKREVMDKWLAQTRAELDPERATYAERPPAWYRPAGPEAVRVPERVPASLEQPVVEIDGLPIQFRWTGNDANPIVSVAGPRREALVAAALDLGRTHPDAPTGTEQAVGGVVYRKRGRAWVTRAEAMALDALGAGAASDKLAALRAEQATLSARAKAEAKAPPPLLDWDAATAILGKDAERLPTVKGGILPDELARAVGAPSGDALLRDMLGMRDRTAWAKAQAGARMAANAQPRPRANLQGTPAERLAAQQVLEQQSFHGTHEENIRQFSLSKIGSGTGLAAEGWGIYSSSLEDIADLYRERAVRDQAFSGGEPQRPPPRKGSPAEWKAWGAKIKAKVDEIAAGGERSIQFKIKTRPGAMLVSPDTHHPGRWRVTFFEPDGTPTGHQEAKDFRAALEAARQFDADLWNIGGEGRVYALDVPENNEILALRKPLSAQEPEVKAALDKAGLLQGNEALTGKDLYRKLAEQWKAGKLPVDAQRPDEAASKYLGSLGIKGASYPAEIQIAGKRGTNFVTWDEGSIRILEKPGARVLEQAGRRSGPPLKPGEEGEVAVGSLVLDEQNLREAEENIRRGAGSMTEGPVTVYARHGSGALELGNGYHRLVEARQRGDARIRVKVSEDVLPPVRRHHQRPIGDGLKVAFMPGAAGKAPRGYLAITPVEGGGEARLDIHLLKADKSTLAHETFHALAEIKGRVASRDDAPADLRAEYQKLLDVMGYKDHAERLAHSDAKKEEKASHLFEAWLSEGRAPSAEMLPWFSRFKTWFKRIYSPDAVDAIRAEYRHQYGEDIELSDSVRQLFARMFAGDEAVADAARDARAEMPKANLTPEEQAESDRLQAEARAGAEAEMQRHLLEDERKTDRAFMKEARARVEVQVRADLEQSDPVFRAAAALERGELDGMPVKLDGDSLLEALGPDVAKQVPRKMVGKEGLHPDAAAELLGFESGAEMIRKVLNGPDREAQVKAATDAQMAARYPKLQDRPGMMREMGRRAYDSEAFLRDGFLRMRAMAREAGVDQPRQSDVASLKAAVDEAIQGKAYKDLEPGRYDATARGFARKAAETKGQVALDHFEAYLFNRAMARAAAEAREGIEKDARHLQKYTQSKKRAELGLASETAADGRIVQPYLDKVDDLLDSFELRAGVSMKEVATRDPQRAALERFVKEKQADGDTIIVPESVMENLVRNKHWKDLTPKEMTDLRNAVDSIAAQAKLRTLFEVGGEKVNVNTVVIPALVEAALKNGAHVVSTLAGDTTKGKGAKIAEAGRRAAHSVMPLREIVDRLDGFDPEGPWHKYVWNVLSDASYRYHDLVRASTTRIQALLEGLPFAERQRMRVPFEVDGTEYTLENAIAALLNSGNESNLTKMVRGNSLPIVSENHGMRPWNGRGTLEKMAQHVTQRDVDLVNEIHATLESHWPAAEALEKKDQGIAPPKLQPKPFRFMGADGQMLEVKGGYYPMLYSREFRSGKMQAEADAAASNGLPGLFGSSYDRVMTPHGYLEQRVESYARPVDLTLDRLPRKLTMEAKDIAFRLPGKQIYRLLIDDRIVGALQQALGDRGADLMMGHLKDAVNDVMIPDVGAGFWMDVLQKMRSNTFKSTFFLNFRQAVQNLADAVGTGSVVRRRSFLRASLKLVRDHDATVAMMLEKFPEMRIRSEGMKALLASELKTAFRRSEIAMKWEQFQELGTLPFEMTQKMTEFPICLGAYYDAIAPKSEGGLGLGEEAAVRHAQDAVLRMYGGKRTIDLSPIQRDPRTRQFTMFYSWAGAQLLKYLRSGAVARKQWTEGQKYAALKTLGTTFARVGAVAIASELLVGRGPKRSEEDDKLHAADVAEWAAWRAVMMPLQSMPIVGSTMRGIGAGFEGETTRDISVVPWTNSFNAVVKAIGKSHRVATAEEGEVDTAQEVDLFLAWLQAGGGFVGAPVNQLRTTAGYWMRRAGDETVGEDVAGSLYGAPRPGTLLDNKQAARRSGPR